jgi:hypothetical protein
VDPERTAFYQLLGVVSHVIAARVYHVKARRRRRAFPDRSDSGYRALFSNCCPRIDKARHQSGVSRFPFRNSYYKGNGKLAGPSNVRPQRRWPGSI